MTFDRNRHGVARTPTTWLASGRTGTIRCACSNGANASLEPDVATVAARGSAAEPAERVAGAEGTRCRSCSTSGPAAPAARRCTRTISTCEPRWDGGRRSQCTWCRSATAGPSCALLGRRDSFVETRARSATNARNVQPYVSTIGAEIAKVATKNAAYTRRRTRLLSVKHAVGDTKHVFGVEFVFHCADDVGVGCG